jgi:hypothetical protein
MWVFKPGYAAAYGHSFACCIVWRGMSTYIVYSICYHYCGCFSRNFLTSEVRNYYFCHLIFGPIWGQNFSLIGNLHFKELIVIHSEINARFEVLVAMTWVVFPPKFCRYDHSSSTSQSVVSPKSQLRETKITKLIIMKCPQLCANAICWLIPLSFKYFPGHFCFVYIKPIFKICFLKETTFHNDTK